MRPPDAADPALPCLPMNSSAAATAVPGPPRSGILDCIDNDAQRQRHAGCRGAVLSTKAAPSGDTLRPMGPGQRLQHLNLGAALAGRGGDSNTQLNDSK